MSASNSISQLLEQFLELNTNSLETFNRINEAITTNKENVVIDLYNSKTGKMETIQIPAFGYLKREIERLNNNISSISGLEGSDANVRLKDGSYRTIHTARLKGPSKDITSLAAPTTFTTKLNEFFEDFLNPLLTINLDVTGQIPVETEKVYVERFIFNSDDIATITAFDEIYKGGSEIDYATFKTALSDNAYKHYIDAEVLEMPMRMIQYNGAFDVVKIDNAEKTYVVDGISQTKTIKLYTVNKLTYTDSTKALKDTETLKVGDSLIVNSGNYRTRYQIVSIDNSTSQIELLLLEGSESVRLGVNQLGIYKDVDTNLDIEIKVGYNERQVVFVKPIDPNSKIPAENFSPGVAFYSNELEISDGDGTTMSLAQYYRDQVSDFGQFIKSLKVDYIPPSSVGITPDAPAIDTTNFKVVQINKHLTDNTNTNKIKQLKSDKIATEQSLKKLDESIKQKKSLVNTKKFKSSAEKDTHTNELNSIVSQRDSESKLFSSIVTEIKSSAESSDLQSVSPKFRVRGFWSIPEPKKIGNEILQEVVQFKIRYRYVSTSGKTAVVDQIKFTDSTNQTEKTAAFSNWVEVLGPVRKRKMNDGGKYEWVIEGEEDADAVNFNSFDIPIVPGEVVEFMVKSISEAGFPANPVESEWSEINKIEFPDGEINTDALGNVIMANEMDALKVSIKEDLESAGIYTHVADSFSAGDTTYSHMANTIASGFLTDQQTPITVYEKLLALQNEVLSLRAVIEKTTGELLVRIIDEDGNVTPVTNNSTVQLFAGYYVNEIPTTGGKGAIVTKNFKIELSNTKATDLELISRIVGDVTKPAPVSTGNTTFGLGTGVSSIDPVYGSNTYYTTEGKYDLVPVVYQNIQGSTEDYFNNGPDQSTQLKGQFIYSRFRNIANDDNLYVINEGPNSNGDINPSTLFPGFGYDTYEYGLSFTYSPNPTITSGVTDFENAAITNYAAAPIQSSEFIWSGAFNGNTPIVTSVGTVGNTNYSNGIYMHKDHPLLQNGPITPISIASNGVVGMPKTAVARASDDHGKKQTPFRLLNTINSNGTVGVRPTIKNGFTPEDQYLLGGRSCGSFLYISPLNLDSLSVNSANKNGSKKIPGGSANSITLDLIFQYRMTDYYGDGGSGRIGGVLTNTFTNLTYSKKIGIDILNIANEEFTFDVEVYAKYATQGKNINNITSSMLTNYNNNYVGIGGRRKYLTDNTVNYSYPDITQW
jgi:hypothetical protein